MAHNGIIIESPKIVDLKNGVFIYSICSDLRRARVVDSKFDTLGLICNFDRVDYDSISFSSTFSIASSIDFFDKNGRFCYLILPNGSKCSALYKEELLNYDFITEENRLIKAPKFSYILNNSRRKSLYIYAYCQLRYVLIADIANYIIQVLFDLIKDRSEFKIISV